jgi:hypothetical protein
MKKGSRWWISRDVDCFRKGEEVEVVKPSEGTMLQVKVVGQPEYTDGGINFMGMHIVHGTEEYVDKDVLSADFVARDEPPEVIHEYPWKSVWWVRRKTKYFEKGQRVVVCTTRATRCTISVVENLSNFRNGRKIYLNNLSPVPLIE